MHGWIDELRFTRAWPGTRAASSRTSSIEMGLKMLQVNLRGTRNPSLKLVSLIMAVLIEEHGHRHSTSSISAQH